MSAAVRWLESGYGIRFDAMRADIFALAVAQGTDRKAVRRMRQLAAARNDAYRTNPAEFRRLTPAFYDAIAADPWQGLYHSAKWTFILDVAAYALAVCRLGRLEGPILDVGCHTGYHATWLAQATGQTVTGLDRSHPALAFAAARAGALGVPGTRFVERLDSDSPKFDFILASDGPVTFEAASLAKWGEHLAPAGVLMLVEEGRNDVTAEIKCMQQCDLRLLHADVLGGIAPEGYTARTVYLFSHTVGVDDPAACLRDRDTAWSSDFREYCNSGGAPREEHTLGWYRSRRLA
jgi:SAM-dependent methyltransferase